MNIRGLGYLCFAVSDPSAWLKLATEVLGLVSVEGPAPAAGRHFLKMDDRQWGIALEKSPTDGLACMGWELASQADFEGALSELRAAGIAVEVSDEAAASERGVCGLARLCDPTGFKLELFWGQKADFETFRSPLCVSGFKTQGMGMGRVLLSVPEGKKQTDFYTGVLGMRLTDLIRMSGGKSAHFIHCTPRHHSIAVMDVLPATGLNHFMIEVNTLDDLGRAFDRATDAKVPIINSLGRHTNDRMVSFYGRTPSGFGFEYGWGGLEIDDATWVVTEFRGGGDLWGHRGSMMEEIASARTGRARN